jgi:hypothetical protein
MGVALAVCPSATRSPQSRRLYQVFSRKWVFHWWISLLFVGLELLARQLVLSSSVPTSMIGFALAIVTPPPKNLPKLLRLTSKTELLLVVYL